MASPPAADSSSSQWLGRKCSTWRPSLSQASRGDSGGRWLALPEGYVLRAQGQDVAKRRAQRCITAPAVSPQQAKDGAGMKKWPPPPFMSSASIGWICRNTPAPRLRAVRPLQERHIPVGKAVFLDQNENRASNWWYSGLLSPSCLSMRRSSMISRRWATMISRASLLIVGLLLFLRASWAITSAPP